MNTANKVSLTPLELQCLMLLRVESEGNGHDFGLLELVPYKNRQQLGGLVSSLREKGVITSLEHVRTDQLWTQFVLHPEHTGEEL